MPEGKQFKQLRGVFVTLTENSELRGCIGFPYPHLPLGDAVIQAAKSAAFADPRFLPLQEKELDKIKIEISVLTPPSELKCKVGERAKNIKIGEDGLIIDYLGYSGLLLPQVAIEHKMNKLEFLEACCEKASLPRDKWQDEKCQIFTFQAQIFSE
jgi:AmmeMemoRadiSam system protein A